MTDLVERPAGRFVQAPPWTGGPAPRPTVRVIPAQAARGTTTLVDVVLLVTLAFTVLVLGLAYRSAALGSESTAFTLFWVALVPWVGVVTWVLLRAGTPRFERSLALVLTGLVMATPKVLRSPNMPLLFDEIAHWRQSTYMMATGTIDQDGVVTVLRDYPGLHTLTVGLERVTGLSTWTLGTVLLLVLRAVTPLLAHHVARGARLPDRAADLAGLVYALNPGFMFFTGMYAYESLAIVFQLASLALVSVVVATGRRRSLAARRMAILLAAAAAVTHHLTSLFLLGATLVLLVSTVRSSTPGALRRRIAGLCLTITAVTLAWTSLHLHDVWGYLFVFPQKAVAQLVSMVHPAAQVAAPATATRSGGSRGILQGAGVPLYESISGLLTVPLLTGLALAGLWMVRDGRRAPSVRLLGALALAYPLSMPFVLTVYGAPGAHRSWPFSYQGLAVFVALALAAIGGAGEWVATSRRRWLTARRVLVGVVLVVVMVGNGAAENHAALRFPGPYEAGAEGRVRSPELLDVAGWAGVSLRTTGLGAGDYYSASYLSAFGRAPQATGFPAWDLIYPGPVPATTVARLSTDNVTFMMVDRRIAGVKPRVGFYVDPSEPPLPGDGTLTIAELTKLEQAPWATKVWSSTDYDVYRFDLSRIKALAAAAGGSK